MNKTMLIILLSVCFNCLAVKNEIFNLEQVASDLIKDPRVHALYKNEKKGRMLELLHDFEKNPSKYEEDEDQGRLTSYQYICDVINQNIAWVIIRALDMEKDKIAVVKARMNSNFNTDEIEEMKKNYSAKFNKKLSQLSQAEHDTVRSKAIVEAVRAVSSVISKTNINADGLLYFALMKN